MRTCSRKDEPCRMAGCGDRDLPRRSHDGRPQSDSALRRDDAADTFVIGASLVSHSIKSACSSHFSHLFARHGNSWTACADPGGDVDVEKQFRSVRPQSQDAEEVTATRAVGETPALWASERRDSPGKVPSLTVSAGRLMETGLIDQPRRPGSSGKLCGLYL
jgi:hypothetical protein